MSGEYGAGLLGGDVMSLQVTVKPAASLLLSTQGATKVFKPRDSRQPTEQRLHGAVAAGGLLVVTPDAVIPFANSKFLQRQQIVRDPQGSVVLVDGCVAGRSGSGERCWAHFGQDCLRCVCIALTLTILTAHAHCSLHTLTAHDHCALHMHCLSLTVLCLTVLLHFHQACLH